LYGSPIFSDGFEPSITTQYWGYATVTSMFDKLKLPLLRGSKIVSHPKDSRDTNNRLMSEARYYQSFRSHTGESNMNHKSQYLQFKEQKNSFSPLSTKVGLDAIFTRRLTLI